MCIRCRVMIWKCIYFCNLPKSVFPTLCQFVPSKVKLSDCQREYSNLLYSAFYPIIFCRNSVYLLWQFRQICVFLPESLSHSITSWANVICPLWRNITYWFETHRFSTYIEHAQYHSFTQKNPRKNIEIWNLSTKFVMTYSPRFP